MLSAICKKKSGPKTAFFHFLKLTPMGETLLFSFVVLPGFLWTLSTTLSPQRERIFQSTQMPDGPDFRFFFSPPPLRGADEGEGVLNNAPVSPQELPLVFNSNSLSQNRKTLYPSDATSRYVMFQAPSPFKGEDISIHPNSWRTFFCMRGPGLDRQLKNPHFEGAFTGLAQETTMLHRERNHFQALFRLRS